MKIIIREEIANKLYKILKKAGSKEIKGDRPVFKEFTVFWGTETAW